MTTTIDSLHPKLSDLLAGVVAAKNIPALHGYILCEPSNNWQYQSLFGRYTSLIRDNSRFQLYVQKQRGSGELVARFLIPKKCTHILHAVLTIIDIRINQMVCHLSIIPQYNAYCRSTLHPFTKTVVHQILKAVACCHKQRVCHNNFGTNSLTWLWNKKQPHVYLTNFSTACVVPDDREEDFQYLCENDLRRVGILLLELVLNEEVFALYPEGVVPIQARSKYYARLKHTPRVYKVIETLISSNRHKVTAKRALKHKFFRK